MSTRRAMLTVATVALLLPALPAPADGQLPNPLRRARNAVEDEVASALERRVRDAVRCTLGDAACVEKARAEGKTTVFVDDTGTIITDADGNPVTDPEDAAKLAEPQEVADEVGTGVWANYDFVPGNTVAFALDLADEPVGRFPARQLEFMSGNAEIVERDGVPLIRYTAPTTFRVNLDEPLPDDYTLELGFQAGIRNAGIWIANGDMPGNMGSFPHSYLYLWQNGGIYFQRQPISTTTITDDLDHELISYKLQVDGDPEIEDGKADYAILYADDERMAQVPNGDFGRGTFIEIHVQANTSRPAFLSELVIAVHGDPLYESLTTGDRAFTTRGILFDFDSDRLRGESTPTLEEIARTLQRHEELTIAIEGHTDSAGDDDYNQALSERRARAVVDYLVEAGIDPSRVTAVGRGESEPVADNSTEAGRQQNRRVVLKNTTAT
ncbi:MAG: OmpA family protein [Gemmatimonadetes bacterium]|nr:OmpA family protein [Gemmatimonadota bacterium]